MIGDFKLVEMLGKCAAPAARAARRSAPRYRSHRRGALQMCECVRAHALQMCECARAHVRRGTLSTTHLAKNSLDALAVIKARRPRPLL